MPNGLLFKQGKCLISCVRLGNFFGDRCLPFCVFAVEGLAGGGAASHALEQLPLRGSFICKERTSSGGDPPEVSALPEAHFRLVGSFSLLTQLV